MVRIQNVESIYLSYNLERIIYSPAKLALQYLSLVAAIDRLYMPFASLLISTVDHAASVIHSCLKSCSFIVYSSLSRTIQLKCTERIAAKAEQW